MPGTVNMKLPIKWNKTELSVEAEASMSVTEFKSLIYSMTNVPVDRMKILGFPGGVLKDDDNFGDKLGKLKPNAKIQLIGTAEGGEIKAPEEKTVFIEDLTPEERAKILKEKKVDVLPVGLQNLENTCYMNSVIQVLKAVPEFKLGLKPKSGEQNAMSNFTNVPSDAQFVTGLRNLLIEMDNTTETVTPAMFVHQLRTRFPIFGQQAGNPPHYQQQDAEECLREMLSLIGNECKTEDGGNLTDKLFGFKMKSEYKCLETEDEPIDKREENTRIFMCHMGTTTEPVSHLHEGVKLSLKEHIEKNSPTLGRMAQYEKTSSMGTLPPYLFVQFARFGYKQANTIAGTDASKVKHVRKCAFSSTLDVYDYASPELKEELNIGRLKLREKKELDLEEERRKIDAVGQEDADVKPMEVDTSDVPKKDFNTGQYELIGIVSHKGRSADGGHYVGWIRTHKKDGKDYKDDQWLLFDDEAVFPYEWKQITGISLDLQGGRADTQIAYVCLYKRVECIMPDTPPKQFNDAVTTKDADQK